MSAPATLPSLFGRFTAVLRDHDHLRTALGELRAMCAELAKQNGGTHGPDPHTLLRTLRADLAAHFSAEEADGYFGTVIDEAPLLGPQVEDLKQEHAIMLGAVDVLCQLAADGSESPRLTDLARRLIARLERHERAETALLRALFQPGAG